MIYSAAVVGLGNIGQGYDYHSDDNARILTHSSAYRYHPGFELVAGVDPDPAARSRFSAKYKKPVYTHLDELFNEFLPNVISIATPVENQFEIFKEVILHCPKAVICEKPFALNIEQGQKMMDGANNAGTLLLVNYMRRFDPGVIKLKRQLEQGEIGEIFKGVVWYTRGILNFASHFIDLLCFLLGPVTSVQLLEPYRQSNTSDPEPDFCLHYGAVPIYFFSGRKELITLKEIDLMTTQGCIRLIRGGEDIVFRRSIDDPNFSGYQVLDSKETTITSDMSRYQFNVLDALHHALRDGNSLNSTGETALQTLTIVNDVLKKAKQDPS